MEKGCEPMCQGTYLIVEVTQSFDRKNCKMRGSKTIRERQKMIQQKYHEERSEHEIIALGHKKIQYDEKELA